MEEAPLSGAPPAQPSRLRIGPIFSVGEAHDAVNAQTLCLETFWELIRIC